MKLRNVEKTEANTAVMTIEVTKEEFDKGLDQAYRQGRKDITVPGFRKGKAPRKVIEATYGTSVFYEDGINLTYPQAYAEAVVEANLEPVDHPAVELVEFPEEGGYVFKATVTLYPEVEMGEYKGLKAERKVEAVTEEDINKELDALRERNARLVTVEREAKLGDTVVIDFKGLLDGVAFDNGSAENYSLALGSGSFIPGFEEQIVGMKAGETKNIDITFPEDYPSKELAGKAVVFEIKLHEVKEKILPELDDDFAQDVSEFDTLDALKENAKKVMTKQRELEADTDFLTAIMDQVLDGMKVDVPKCLVDNQIDMMVQDQDMMLQQQGLSMEKYAEMMGQTMDIIKEGARPTAEKMVKTELALNKVAELENVEVTDEDIENEFKMLADTYKMEVDQVKSIVKAEDITNDIRRRKAQQIIRDASVVAKKRKPAAKKTAEEPAGEAAEEKPAAKKTTAKKTTTKKAAAETKTEAEPEAKTEE